ncbi:MAG: hypothetical protein ACRC0M_09455 [Legionella sp.]
MPISKGIAAAKVQKSPSEPDILWTGNNGLSFFIPKNTSHADLQNAASALLPKRSRTRSDYQKNKAASLMLDLSSEELLQHRDNHDKLLQLSKSNIIAHATMRIDLFFYTLCAYYNQKLQPILGRTYLQHGCGRSSDDQQLLSSACHDSMLPSLIDESVFALGQPCILSGTAFMNSLNSTTELPPFVNALDDKLEALCRQKSLDILCCVSSGEINPVEGLALFMRLLKNSFEDLGCKAIKEKNKLMHSLINLLVEHTVDRYFDEETETVDQEYIYMMLQLSAREKAQCYSGRGKAKILMDKILEAQSYILTNENNSRQDNQDDLVPDYNALY